MTQIEQWRGGFGDEYVERNRPDEVTVRGLTGCFAQILAMTGPLESVCEIGANVGRNLLALDRISSAEVTAVEPNARARAELESRFKTVDAQLGSRLPFRDAAFDFVFTSGVLIHVPPEDLDYSVEEMIRISAKWVFAAEYFNPTAVEIPYRDRENMLWKRDFGSMFLDRGLQHIASGFWWRRTTPFDDTNWWLFRQ